MTFSISDLEQLSGISAHTIRIWERRYNALDPLRSSGNTRLYDDNHLRRLLNIASLVQSGLKISNICSLTESQIDGLLKKEMDRTVSKDVHFEYYITQLINHGFSYDEIQLNRLLSECIGDFGMATTYKEVIYPLLVRLGLMWRRDQFCPSQEHFLTSVIRQKIFSAINSLPLNSSPAPSWLLFLPEDENHEIGLLFANYLLRLKGHSVIYLGPRVPISAVKHAIVKNQSNNILLFMINRRPITEADSYLAELSGCFQNIRVYLAGNAKFIGALELNQNVNWLRSLQEFEQVINSVDDAN